MKKISLFIAFLALVITSCVNEEIVQTKGEDNLIKFGPYVNKMTKSILYTNATFGGFTLYGYKNATTIDWSTLPTLFMQSEVSRNNGAGDATWTTAPVYWPTAGTHVMFYGFSPNINATFSASASTGPTLYIQNTSQVDYLVGKSSDITALAAGSNARVTMSFTHAMSKISFKALVPSGLTAKIMAIEIHGLATYGTYNFNSGTWTSISGYGGFVPILSAHPVVVSSTTAIDVLASNGAVPMIPQSQAAWTVSGSFDRDTQCRLLVTYNLMNNADNTYIVGGASSYVDAYLPIALTLLKDNAYTITLTFGDGGSASGGGGYDANGVPIISTSNTIKFTTTFTDWTDAGSSSSSM